MCGAFYPNYFLKGQVDEESALREMSGNDPLNTVMVEYNHALHYTFQSVFHVLLILYAIKTTE